MFNFLRPWALSLLVAISLASCSQFEQSDKSPIGGLDPIIIVDGKLGENYIPKENISSVMGLRFLVDPYNVKPDGKMVFLKEPVSGVDPRVLVGTWPRSTYWKQAKKDDAAKGKKPTFRERKQAKMMAANPGVPKGVTYEDPSGYGKIELTMEYPGTNNYDPLPNVFVFGKDVSDKNMLVLKTSEKKVHTQESLRADFGGMATASVKSIKTTNFKGAASMKPSGASAQGFLVPSEFFVPAESGATEPTDLADLTINVKEGVTFNWLKSSQSGTFMSISIRIVNEAYKPNVPLSKATPFLPNPIFMDTVDDGSETISPETLGQLKLAADAKDTKTYKAEVQLSRIYPQVYLISGVPKDSKDDKSVDKQGIALMDMTYVGVVDIVVPPKGS